MFFYRKNEDGAIIDFVEFTDGQAVPRFVVEQYTATNKKIVQSLSGQIMFEDELDTEQEQALALQAAKDEKLRELKAERDRVQTAPLEYNGKMFDYDQLSVTKLNEAKDDLDAYGGTQMWICADNTITTLTAEDIAAIKHLGKVRSNEAHIKYAQLRDVVNGLPNIEAVASIKVGE